jgi:hypothetical protein
MCTNRSSPRARREVEDLPRPLDVDVVALAARRGQVVERREVERVRDLAGDPRVRRGVEAAQRLRDIALHDLQPPRMGRRESARLVEERAVGVDEGDDLAVVGGEQPPREARPDEAREAGQEGGLHGSSGPRVRKRHLSLATGHWSFFIDLKRLRRRTETRKRCNK